MMRSACESTPAPRPSCNVFICPSSTRNPDGTRDGADPNDGGISTATNGYGYTDYGPTPYTDIDPLAREDLRGPFPATPFRNKYARVNGLLKQGQTRIAQITDGTSNTIMIGEDAGRSPYYISMYSQNVYDGNTITTTQYLATNSPTDPGPAGGELLYRRTWRWAEPDSAFGVSGTPNNKYRPDQEVSPWLTTGPFQGRAATRATTKSCSLSTRAASTSCSAMVAFASSRIQSTRSRSGPW